MTHPDRLRWLVLLMVGQVLYSAGATLTSGSFLIYYVRQWTADSSTIAWFLILPELVHLVALSATYFIHRLGSAKRVWFWGAIAARGLSLILAATGYFDPEAEHPDAVLPLLFGLLALSECFRAISYVAFIAWIAELWGRQRLGRLFGFRESAIITVSIVLPPVAAFFREWLATHPEVSDVRAYSTVFILADLAVYLGVAVMCFIPARSTIHDEKAGSSQEEAARQSIDSVRRVLWSLLKDRSVRRVMLTSLHLAAAQGLTQSVLFKYQVDELHVELTTKTLLETVMFVVQLPLAILAGYLLDRLDNRYVYAIGLTLVAGAMPFLLMAEFDPRWLTMTYAFWGAFAIVNVSGRSTLLRLVHRDDVPTATTVFRFGAGLMAAITGLLGGYWLDAGLDGRFIVASLGPYWTIILVSAIGRVTAAFWLFGWSDVRTQPKLHAVRPRAEDSASSA